MNTPAQPRGIAPLCILGLLLAGWGYAAMSASAQKPMYLLEETQVQDGHQPAFESAQKEYCAAVVRGGAPACQVLTPTTLSRQRQYLTLLAVASFAHYDEGTYTSKGMTATEAKDLQQRRSPTIESNHETLFRTIDSNEVESRKNKSVVMVTEVELVPGTETVFFRLLKQWHTGKAAASVPYEILQASASGSPDRILILHYFSRFADLDTMGTYAPTPSADVEISYRAEAVKGVVQSVQINILRDRQDLGAKADR
jgi:hypothetical protein